MKQFVVIGLGRFGVSVATELYKMGHEVLAIDSNVERIDEIADSVTHAVCADADRRGGAELAGPAQFRCCGGFDRLGFAGKHIGHDAVQGTGR